LPANLPIPEIQQARSGLSLYRITPAWFFVHAMIIFVENKLEVYDLAVKDIVSRIQCCLK
jgi:hypothetical protein